MRIREKQADQTSNLATNKRKWRTLIIASLRGGVPTNNAGNKRMHLHFLSGIYWHTIQVRNGQGVTSLILNDIVNNEGAIYNKKTIAESRIVNLWRACVSDFQKDVIRSLSISTLLIVTEDCLQVNKLCNTLQKGNETCSLECILNYLWSVTLFELSFRDWKGTKRCYYRFYSFE